MTNESLLLYECIVFDWQAIEHTFHKRTMLIAETVNHIVQHLSVICLNSIGVAKVGLRKTSQYYLSEQYRRGQGRSTGKHLCICLNSIGVAKWVLPSTWNFQKLLCELSYLTRVLCHLWRKGTLGISVCPCLSRCLWGKGH